MEGNDSVPLHEPPLPSMKRSSAGPARPALRALFETKIIEDLK
jgi:hypothetical protein